MDQHHVVHWVDGGKHEPRNLVSLCRRHHRLVHEGGVTIQTRPGGELVFGRPDGDAIGTRPPALRGDVRALAQVVAKPAAAPSGDPLDLDLTVDVLC